MKWIIDRLEDDKAVIECDGKNYTVLKAMLPQGVSEGDIITLTAEACDNRRQQMKDLMNKVFEK